MEEMEDGPTNSVQYHSNNENRYKRYASANTPTKRVSPDFPEHFYGYDRAIKEEIKFYITAEVLSKKLPAKIVVGDGKIYHGYKNKPLKPETFYKAHIRAKSKEERVSFFFSEKSYLACEVSD